MATKNPRLSVVINKVAPINPSTWVEQGIKASGATPTLRRIQLLYPRIRWPFYAAAQVLLDRVDDTEIAQKTLAEAANLVRTGWPSDLDLWQAGQIDNHVLLRRTLARFFLPIIEAVEQGRGPMPLTLEQNSKSCLEKRMAEEVWSEVVSIGKIDGGERVSENGPS